MNSTLVNSLFIMNVRSFLFEIWDLRYQRQEGRGIIKMFSRTAVPIQLEFRAKQLNMHSQKSGS